MNSKQGSRYIKRRMGNDLKNKILEQNGIITQDYENPKSLNLNCSKCSYPLKPSAYEEIKKSEENRIGTLEQKYNQDIKDLKTEMENKFQYLLSKIDLGKL